MRIRSSKFPFPMTGMSISGLRQMDVEIFQYHEIIYFRQNHVTVRALESNHSVRALHRRFAFPIENTDFGMCVRGKFLRKYVPSNRYRSAKSGSNFRDHSTLAVRLSNLLETLPGPSGVNVTPFGATINKSFSDNELLTMSRYIRRNERELVISNL